MFKFISNRGREGKVNFETRTECCGLALNRILPSPIFDSRGGSKGAHSDRDGHLGLYACVTDMITIALRTPYECKYPPLYTQESKSGRTNLVFDQLKLCKQRLHCVFLFRLIYNQYYSSSLRLIFNNLWIISPDVLCPLQWRHRARWRFCRPGPAPVAHVLRKGESGCSHLCTCCVYVTIDPMKYTVFL